MARWFAVVAVFALAAAVPEAHAKANRFLKKAKKAYQNLDYTRVTPLLTRALKVSKTDEEKVEIYFLLGTMHAIYSRDKQAAEAFAEVLKRDPLFELPADTSPKIRAAFDEAREVLSDVPVAVDGVVPGNPETTDDEVIAATSVEDELPEGLFGPTDGMPGLSRRDRGTPWYTKWWVWTIVGVAVAGGTGYLIYSLNQVDYPGRDYGPIPLQ